ncbi:MAG: hypothetical protein HY689_16235 [Chloroflexi bacterium]|nr:hypothetical protein [Chloroflexota bacterium]
MSRLALRQAPGEQGDSLRAPTAQGPAAPTVTLHCTTLIVLALGFLAASVGMSQPNAVWWREVTIGSGLVMGAWGTWLGLNEVRQLLRRRWLRRRVQPLLVDRARYLSGHPALPRPRRLTVLLTADALLLDDDRRSLRVPLTALRQALLPDPRTGRTRPWLVARNEYRTPQDRGARLSVEFLDDGGIPRRVALTDFRRTRPEDWNEAISAQLAAIRDQFPTPPCPPLRTLPVGGHGARDS